VTDKNQNAIWGTDLPYTSLDPEKIIFTAEKLHERVRDRFPEAGLEKVSAELVVLARQTEKQAKDLGSGLN